MSSLYGFVPNVVQQQTQLRPATVEPVIAKQAEITPVSAPAIPKKVAPAFESAASAKTNPHTDRNADKAQMVVAAKTQSTASRLAAESKVAASDDAATNKLTPADLADHCAQELAQAREHASQYRAYKERLESVQSQATSAVGEDGEPTQKMDVRIPFPDEMPDRPLPRFGVETV